MCKCRAFPFFVLLVFFISLTSRSAESQTFAASDAVENTSNGTINWTIGQVSAKGIGAPPALAVNAAQARAMAERAAFVVAIRNLLETVKGVRIDSETLVENFMTKSDVIRTRVDGIVRGARIVKTEYLSDGSVEVIVSMAMKGAFMNAIVPETFGSSAAPVPQKPSLIPQKPSDIKPPQPVKPSPPAVPEKKREPDKPAPAPEVKGEPIQSEPQPDKRTKPARPEPTEPSPAPQSDATVVFKGGVATGLIIDGRGLGLRPALLPKIVDQQGKEIYVGQVVTRTNAVEQGVAGYAKDVNAAANNFRVTDNPAVIKGLNTTGSARTDIVLGQPDAQALRQLSSKGDFLQYCRVIIVY